MWLFNGGPWIGSLISCPLFIEQFSVFPIPTFSPVSLHQLNNELYGHLRCFKELFVFSGKIVPRCIMESLSGTSFKGHLS